MEGSETQNALLTMWIVFPNQAAGLQGLFCEARGALAVTDQGIGPDKAVRACSSEQRLGLQIRSPGIEPGTI